MKPKARLTHIQVLQVVERYPDEKAGNIAADFNINVELVYNIAKRYGVKKSESFRCSEHSGRIMKGQRKSVSTEFKPGHIPCFISKKKLQQNKNLWQKGHKPHNTGENGEIRFRHNPGFFFIKINDNNWEFLHRHIWKQHHGPIPAGFNVIFTDGNHKNCTIENLECISNEELALRNTIHRYPKEVVELIRLKQRINKYIKNNKNE